MLRSALVVSSAFLLSCFGTSIDVSSSDVSSFQARASDLAASVATYRASANSMSSTAHCTAALAQYKSSAGADLDAMGALSDRMDAHMSGMGTHDGDMRCGMNLGTAEMQRHMTGACSSSDMAQNRAEAVRHCDAMQPIIDHLQMRGSEMGEMISGGMGMGGMMNGSQLDGGWMMADGGMMPYGHHLPGCGADAGH